MRSLRRTCLAWRGISNLANYMSVRSMSVGRTHNPYMILGCSPGSSKDDVRAAFRRRALDTHPDRNPNEVPSGARFRQVNEAYNFLTSAKMTEARHLLNESIFWEVFGVRAHHCEGTLSHVLRAMQHSPTAARLALPGLR